ncbi:MAG: SPOR domain-containing protein [Bacteroidales bacterium]|nr:SPOR domain-containing protein [Bacteroidales bacterium]HOY38671.1 SPOR domain-containing protein [Bacteroidales bacterium]HQP04042.1 SPOR domain-containing protein [Bacteroidales bacterium]
MKTIFNEIYVNLPHNCVEMNLQNYLISLLYEHNCVILPGFGGFVVNYKEAVIDFQNQKLSPPSRIVAFNQNLNVNDGLLADFIARSEKITYDEALHKIENFVAAMTDDLGRMPSVALSGIGSFAMNHDTLEFRPEAGQNFLRDSFGLESFHFPLLKTAKPREVIEEKAKTVVSTVTVNRRIKPSWAIGIPAAAAIFILAVMFFNQDNLKFNIQQNTEMNPLYVGPTKNIDDKTNTVSAEAVLPQAEKPDATYNQPAEVQSVDVAAQNELKVHVIAGSFSQQENALTMAESLKTVGYNAQILHIEPWYKVSIKAFATPEEAAAELNALKQATGNNALWVMTN